MAGAAAERPSEQAPRERLFARAWMWVLLGAIVTCAILIVFVLPWFVPIAASVVVSDAQAAGFSNTTAVLGLIAACAAMASVAYVARRLEITTRAEPVIEREAVPAPERVDRRLVVAVGVLALGVIAVIASISRDAPWGDASYFMNAILRTAGGGRPYSEIAFAYGPLLLYAPLGAWRIASLFGVGPYATYYAWVAACHVIGLLLGVYVLNHLRMSRQVRNWAFVLLGAFDLLQFHLGPNYTWLRFLLAYAALLWVGSRLSRTASTFQRYAAPSLAVILVAAVSPEMGVALLVGLAGVLVLRLWRNVKASSIVSLAVLVVAGSAGVALLPKGSVGAFTAGALNFPVLPGLPQIAFVIAMLFVAFNAGSLGDRLAEPSAALSAGWSLLALVLVAPAFGRADFGHVFWNGIGAFLLCFALAERWHRGRAVVRATGGVFILAAAIYAATCFGAIFDIQVRNGVFSQEGAIAAAKLAGKPASSGEKLWQQSETARPTAAETAQLARLPHLGFTDSLTGQLGVRLAESGNLVPLYADPASCIDIKGFDLAMSQLRDAETIAVPASLLDQYRGREASAAMPAGEYVMSVPRQVLNPELNGALFWVPVRLPGRYAVFNPTVTFVSELNTSWREVGRTDHYVLLEREYAVAGESGPGISGILLAHDPSAVVSRESPD
jgi:hypothetical protein